MATQIDPRMVRWDDSQDGINSLVAEEAKRQGVPVDLALALVKQESGGKQSAVSPKGAIGAMQLMPGTAKELGVDPADPVQNVRGGVTYLKQQLDRFGTPELALAAYNAGPGAVAKHGGVPPYAETRDYVSKVSAGAQNAAKIDPRMVRWDQAQQAATEPSKSAEAPFFAGGFTGVLGGILRGLRDPIDAGAQMLVRGANKIGLAPDSEVARVDAINKAAEQDYKQNWRKGQDVGFDGARLVGGVAGTAPLAAIAPLGTGLAARTALGGVTGAGFGALQPVDTQSNPDFWTEKSKQAGLGAAFGAIAAPVTSAISRVISPKSSAEVQTLLKEGVTPTPGQVLGGAFKAAEEKAASVPILGSAIRVGQQRATEQLNEAAINRALFPIGTSLPKGVTGREAIDFAETALSKRYTSVLDRVGAAPVDDQLVNELASLRGMLANQPKDIAGRLERIIDNEVLARTEYGRLTGEAVKKAESNLGQLAAGLRRSQDYDTTVLGQAVSEAQRSLRSWLQRVAPADVADDLAKANQGWANFKRVQRASSALGADEGVFTAAQLQNAVKALDRSKDKASFARGDALMQDLSDPAKTVLSSKVPNSGTADRALFAGALLGPLAGGGISPALPLAALPAAAYLPGIQRGVASLFAGRQQAPFKAASESLLTLSPALGAALAPTGYGLLQ